MMTGLNKPRASALQKIDRLSAGAVKDKTRNSFKYIQFNTGVYNGDIK